MMHADVKDNIPDDTWAVFNREEALSMTYYYKVTVFKTGKVTKQQKQQKCLYLYDNGATLNFFCNEEVLWDVQPIRFDKIENVWVNRRGIVRLS